MTEIAHITSVEEWESQKDTGVYTAPSLESQGYIHLSRKEQVCGTLNRWFKTSDSVLLLLIDSEKIQASSKLVYEAPDGNHDSELTFPHLYGPLNVSAVTGTQLVTRESGSEWKLEFN